MMQTSETIDALAVALVKAQAEIKPALKDATNPHLKSKYADLASVWSAARETLGKHGLCVIQAPGRLEGNTLDLTTRLLHSSGQWIESTITLPVVKLDAQTCGGAITYARRYALSSMLGIVADDDDDGHAGTHGAQGRSQQRQREPEPNPGPARTRQAVENAEERKSIWTANQRESRPAPESNGDKAAAGQSKLGLELDAKREEIKQSLAACAAAGIVLSESERRFAESWAVNSALDTDRADHILKNLAKKLGAADPNPTPGYAR
jgi:hypothetical protein